jgi:diaminopimelate decarboxylase
LVHHFQYKDGACSPEDVDLTALSEKVGTPFYVYSAAALRRHVRVMREALRAFRRSSPTP